MRRLRPVADLVAAAKAETSSLTPQTAQARAEAGEALLVDVRDVRELAREGRIPGAVHAPRGMLEFWIDPDSPYHRAELSQAPALILFCAAAQRSALAAKALQDMGHDAVFEIEGGFGAWRDAGLPVERDG